MLINMINSSDAARISMDSDACFWYGRFRRVLSKVASQNNDGGWEETRWWLRHFFQSLQVFASER